MMRNVWVSVCGVHVTDEEQEPIRTVSAGSYISNRGQHRIRYRELSADELAGGNGNLADGDLTDSEVEVFEAKSADSSGNLADGDVTDSEAEVSDPKSAGGSGNAVITEMTISRLLKVQGRELRYVDLRKSYGNTHTRMRFVPGQKRALDYQTPYGPIAMEVETHDVFVEESEDALRVQIQYDLAMEGQHVSTCMLTVEVKPR